MSGGLSIRSVSKRFGALAALEDVSLEFRPGEVHALLGENGAGKSTLVNIVSGLLAPDSGQILLNDKPLVLSDAVAAKRAGIGVVHQHFTLVKSFTVIQNIALFRVEKPLAFLNVRKLAAPALERAKALGWNLDPDARVRDLPVGLQQRIEILKSLGDDQQVLLFDEPTAPLSREEVAELLRILKELATQGKVVVLIAHKLQEVLAVADRISILRRGKVVAASLPAREATAEGLAKLMVGDMPQAPVKGISSDGEIALKVENLSVKGDRGEPAVRGVSFTVANGEIYGIGGVDGNGQVELAEAIAGVRLYRGNLALTGSQVVYIPADRQGDGLALGMTVTENLLLGRLKNWPKRSEIAAWAKKLIEKFDVRISNPNQPVRDLSGGNQQKLIVARTLDSRPDLVVALNPTRGLDLKASHFVLSQLREAAVAGAAVILISADVDELAANADSVVFLSRGQLVEGSGAAALVGGTQ